jgi:vacuolar-type H+-ATPase subunit F/Vma7
MSYSVAIIGPKEETHGFEALGVIGFDATTAEEAKAALFQIKKGLSPEANGKKYAIVFVIESLIKEISTEDYNKLSSGALPSIIPIPGNSGSSGFGNEKIRRIVEQAVGSDIFGS